MDTKSKTVRLSGKVITVVGEVDMNSAPKLREKLRKTFDAKPNTVTLDLSEVTYMDSAGMAVLVEALQWSKKEKVVFVLSKPSPAARAVIEMARLTKFFIVENPEPGAAS